MKKVLLLSVLGSGSLFGAENAGEMFGLYINQSLLTYSTTTVSTKIDSTTTDVATSELQTHPMEGMEINAQYGPYRFVFSPTASAGKAMKVGYQLSDMLTVGGLFGMTSQSVDTPEYSKSQMEVGAFGYYTMPAGTAHLELGASLALLSKSTTSAATTALADTTTTKTSGMKLVVDGTYVRPLGHGISYLGGLSYEMATDNNSDADTTVTSGMLGVKIFGLRLSL